MIKKKKTARTRTAPRPNRLFVWDGVLTDWTSGIMFAIAPDVTTARALILANPEATPGGTFMTDLAKEPTVYSLTQQVSRVVWGGS